MRLVRVQTSARKTVIYHPSFGDVWSRFCCLFGGHDYEVVLEYPTVGATEEMCVHCLKERYTVNSRLAKAPKASSTV